ncbi:MAG TPA: LysR family transcriptional regulator [Guyparkeria sp.]|nr:LysR family transcriptional regulator [Guyparkeria sp.]
MSKKSRQKRLPGEAYAPRIHARLWLIDAAGEHYLGVGKVRLMEAIDELGTISHAARKLGMSYKRAWSLIQEVNQLEDEIYVTREVGGAGGGHAKVTEAGHAAIARYRELEDDLRDFLAERARKRGGQA